MPLRIGGGTRLKIVESLGIGTPVVSTTIGAQGLDLKADSEILYADTPAEFVAQTAKALRDSELRALLEQNGRAAVKERLSWETLSADLRSAYNTKVFSEKSMAAGIPTPGPEPVLN